MGAGRPRRAVAAAASPTASIRPTRPRRCSTCARTRAPRVLFVEDDEQLDKALEVRARLPLLRKIVVFDMEGLRDFDDPSVISLDALARARPRATASAHPGELDAARRRLPARRPGDPGLHLGHHRQAQGRDALARAASSTRCAATTRSSRQDEQRRAHVLPAAVPHRRALGGEYFAHVHRRDPQLRREPGDRARERARDRADRVHRRAARVGEVLFGRDDRAAAKRAALQQAAYAWAIGVGTRVADRVLAGQPVGAVAASCAVHAGALARAGQRAQADRHPPRALPASPARRRSRPSWCAGTWRSACRCSRSGA